jgi:hypothetical protein
VWFDFFEFIFKIDWAVTVNANFFDICLANFATLSNVDGGWKKLVFLGVDDWVGVDWYQDLVTFTVDSYAVIEVFVFVIWSELHVDVLTDTRWNHTFLIVLNFEKWSLRW